MSTLRGSGSDSGTAPASGVADTSEGIALVDSVALAEGLAEGMDVVSAEDIAEGIASGFKKSGLRIPKRPPAEFARAKEFYEVLR